MKVTRTQILPVPKPVIGYVLELTLEEASTLNGILYQASSTLGEQGNLAILLRGALIDAFQNSFAS